MRSMEKRHYVMVLAAMFLSVAAYLLFVWRLSLGNPPLHGNGPEYESIAYSLWQGKGFVFTFSDPAFRKPYEEFNRWKTYENILNRQGDRPTTYRPPLYPAFLAANYTVFGRNFAVIRLWSCLLLAAAIVMGFHLCVSLWGWGPSFFYVAITALCLFAVYSVPLGAFDTEPLAAVGLAALALLFLHLSPSLSHLSTLGIVMGLMCLLRAHYALWLVPWLSLTYYLVSTHRDTLNSAAAFRKTLFCAAFVIATLLPWGIRNSIQLQSFMPFGSLPSILLPMGYSDGVIEGSGKGMYPYREDIFASPVENAEIAFQEEKLFAVRGVERASRWLVSHWEELPALSLLKVRHLWSPKSPWLFGLYLLSCLGAFSILEKKERLILLSFPVFCSLAVAMSWSAGSAYLVPIFPMVILLGAHGAWMVAKGLIKIRSKQPTTA